MKASSKKSPCPVCRRDTDDKCRWNSESILCYSGDKFGPSKNLKKGDKIRISGEEWILISYSAGFSAASYLFVLDDGRYRRLSPQQKSDLNRKKVVLAKKAILAFREIEDKFFAFLAPRDFTYLSSEEINNIEALNDSLIQLCDNLNDFLSLNRISIKQLTAIRKRLGQMHELLQSTKLDILFFRRELLGELLPSDVSGIRSLARD